MVPLWCPPAWEVSPAGTTPRSFVWFSNWEKWGPFGHSTASPCCALLEKLEDKMILQNRVHPPEHQMGTATFGGKYGSCPSPRLVFHVSPLVKNIFKQYWVEFSQFWGYCLAAACCHKTPLPAPPVISQCLLSVARATWLQQAFACTIAQSEGAKVHHSQAACSSLDFLIPPILTVSLANTSAGYFN